MDDETLIAAYTLREGETVVTSLTMEELEALPEFIMDTLNIGRTCVYNGIVYGTTEEQVRSDEETMWRKIG